MAIYNVANNAQLTAALAKAVGGDRILLAAGSYSSLAITGRLFSSLVTVEAQAPGSAHLDQLTISKSSNITFIGLDLGRALKPGEASYVPLNQVSDSTSVSFSGVNFHGSADGNFTNDGYGLRVMNSRGVSVAGSTFSDVSNALVVYDSDQVRITGNRFEHIASDGIDSSGNKNIQISGNVFRDFHPSRGDHPDAIQFFNTNKSPGQSNITISDNIIMQGSGGGIQGIYLGNPGALGYQNVSVKNNLVYINDAWNGLLVYGGDKLNVVGNTFVSNPNDSKFNWISINSSKSVLIQDNVADRIQISSGTGVTSLHNATLADQPMLKSLFANLLSPSSAQDLIIPGYGYHPSSTNAPAPPTSGPGTTSPIAPPTSGPASTSFSQAVSAPITTKTVSAVSDAVLSGPSSHTSAASAGKVLASTMTADSLGSGTNLPTQAHSAASGTSTPIKDGFNASFAVSGPPHVHWHFEHFQIA